MQAAALLFSACLLLILDQSAKAMVVARFPAGRSMSFGGVTIRSVLNRKIPRGSFRSNAALAWLWGAETVFMVAMVQFGPFFQGPAAAVALGAALGGAGSNLLDRVRRGGVVDFIDFRFWPVFNFADVAIAAGIVMAVLHA
jgi:signal peptidase II